MQLTVLLTTIRAAWILQSHSVRPQRQTLAVTSPLDVWAALAVTSQLDADTGKGTDTHGGAFTLLECANVSKTTIRAASIWQSHSVRLQTLAVTSPLDADTRKGTYTQARDWFLRTTPSALPKTAWSSKLLSRSISPPLLLQVGSFLSQLEVTCMRRKLSAANQQSEQHGFGNHSVRPQALSATSQMDAWAALSATSQMDAWQHYPRPRRWTLTL